MILSPTSLIGQHLDRSTSESHQHHYHHPCLPSYDVLVKLCLIWVLNGLHDKPRVIFRRFDKLLNTNDHISITRSCTDMNDRITNEITRKDLRQKLSSVW